MHAQRALHQNQYLIVDKFTYRWLHPPQRGDIIVFIFPQSSDRDFIKRVIGRPGEKVEIRQGRVYINDRLLEEPYITNPGISQWGPEVVPADSYFVLGDNRPNSSDSRAWRWLPRDHVIGRAWLSYWPPQRWGLVPTGHPTFASSP